MSEHRYDKNIGSCVDPNPLRVERQDPGNFPRLQTRERCALEIAAYVFKGKLVRIKMSHTNFDYEYRKRILHSILNYLQTKNGGASVGYAYMDNVISSESK